MSDILSLDCLKFLNKLHEKFEGSRQELLLSRPAKLLFFAEKSKEIRESDWTCAPIPDDLKDRTVEITGPAAPTKMVINALNSGANCYMADFEDSLSPTWNNIVEGHKNMVGAVNKTLNLAAFGKEYKLNEKTAVLHVRPRGLHMTEGHFFDMSASLFDFGVNFFNTIYWHKTHGSSPYYYIPKLEHSSEAAWWRSVFDFAEDYMGVEKGTIRCTVLIETLPAVFQMHEILYELSNYITGLNCGRWDYIFSMIKCNSKTLLPDRSQVGMTQPCMEAYSRLLVETCHKRGVAAMGGMAAQVPIKGDPEASAVAINKVAQDKIIEVSRGHDGTWVAHPALVSVAQEAFGIRLSELFEKDLTITFKEAKPYSRDELLEKPKGTITPQELINNVSVSIEYIANWIKGNGCVAINHLMEDAATAEIARTQVWQWLKHRQCTVEEVNTQIADAVRRLRTKKNREFVDEAARLFRILVFADNPPEFLTTVAYDALRFYEE